MFHPFWLGISRILVVKKTLWILVASVNDGVKKNVYLGTEYELHYTSVETITNLLRNLGTSAQMYKIDISRDFAILR